MSTTDHTETTETARPQVVFDRSLQLSVPVIADRDQMDRLLAAAEAASGHELTAAARDLEIGPPTARHRWALGWSAPADEGEASVLVWYDPDKLDGITATVNQVREQHPDVGEVRVLQGAAWNDWGVAFSTPRHDAEAPTAPQGPAGTEGETTDEAGELPSPTSPEAAAAGPARPGEP